jgi:hypothetical protein
MANYVDMDGRSMRALDILSRDVREARELRSFSTNQLVFVDFSSNLLTYAWHEAQGQLVRRSGSMNTVLLENCDFLAFHISQRTPTNGQFGFYPAYDNAAMCKMIDVSWRCSRTILGQSLNTESVQTAKIVMRN